MGDFRADYVDVQAFCAEMRAILKAYPRHVEGRIVQQGGVTFLRDDIHRWYLPTAVAKTIFQDEQEHQSPSKNSSSIKSALGV